MARFRWGSVPFVVLQAAAEERFVAWREQQAAQLDAHEVHADAKELDLSGPAQAHALENAAGARVRLSVRDLRMWLGGQSQQPARRLSWCPRRRCRPDVRTKKKSSGAARGPWQAAERGPIEVPDAMSWLEWGGGTKSEPESLAASLNGSPTKASPGTIPKLFSYLGYLHIPRRIGSVC